MAIPVIHVMTFGTYVSGEKIFLVSIALTLAQKSCLMNL